MIRKRSKDLRGRLNDPKIIDQLVVPYSLENNSRYKHIDELVLVDGKRIKATLGPIDIGIFPYDGMTDHIVSEAEKNRIDIVATKHFGSASLYWVICYLNNIPDPLNIPEGLLLKIPRLDSLRKFPNPLS